MPKKTIYVRVEDNATFEQVYTPEWLHRKLQEEQNVLKESLK